MEEPPDSYGYRGFFLTLKVGVMRVTPNAFDLLIDGNTTEDDCSCGGRLEDFDHHGIYACWNEQ